MPQTIDQLTSYGMIQIDTNSKNGTSDVMIFDTGHKEDEDFWLTVVHPEAGHVIGYLHFCPIAEGCFSIDRIRPALCPIRNLEDVCKQHEPPQKEDS